MNDKIYLNNQVQQSQKNISDISSDFQTSEKQNYRINNWIDFFCFTVMIIASSWFFLYDKDQFMLIYKSVTNILSLVVRIVGLIAVVNFINRIYKMSKKFKNLYEKILFILIGIIGGIIILFITSIIEFFVSLPNFTFMGF